MTLGSRSKLKSRKPAAVQTARRSGRAPAKKPVAAQSPPDRVELGSLDDMIGFLVRLAQIELFAMFYEDFKGIGLGPGESSALLAIHQNPGIRQGVLAGALRIKRSNMAKMIANLNRRDLIERAIPSSDKRAIQLYLSGTGRTLAAHLLPHMIKHDARIATMFSVAERKLLIALLKRISRRGAP